jgi:hypothetical protein
MSAAGVPAQSGEAEQALLGAMLVAESAVAAAIDEAKLRADDFYFEKHATIFGAIRDLHAAGKPTDELSVAGELTSRGHLDLVGGRDYISALAAKVPAVGNAAHYAAIVRRHALTRAKREVGQQLLNGLGTDEAIERLAALAAESPSTAAPSDPFAVPAAEFITTKGDAPQPLIGSEDDNILPAYGLLLLVAKGGKGKTTATLDAVLHFASGLPWLGFEVPQPLNILLIENEGPREPFRRKLERRLGHWPHPLKGAIDVYDQNWGQARLDQPGFVERLNSFVEENQIDIVVGDPLDTLGMEGVGSPEDTRTMVGHFQAAGLFSRVAWWVPHHARKEKVEDAIDEVSGSWGGKPDALLGLEKLDGGRARLGFVKLRWGRRDGFAYLLGYDEDSEGFEFISEMGDEDRDLDQEIRQLLAESGGWKTVDEIAAKEESGGIGAKRTSVKEVLEANDSGFVMLTGPDAKALDRNPRAELWGLDPTEVRDVRDSKNTPTQPTLDTCLDSRTTLKGSRDETGVERGGGVSRPDAGSRQSGPDVPDGSPTPTDPEPDEATEAAEAEVDRIAEKFGEGG